MSWIFSGSNCVVFSGTDGKIQYEGFWASCRVAELPPQFAGDKQRRFIWQGFVFVYNPMQ